MVQFKCSIVQYMVEIVILIPLPCNKGVPGRLSELPLIEDICQAKLKPSECSVVHYKCSIVQYMVDIVVLIPPPLQ